MSGVQLIDRALIHKVLEDARRSPRRRMNHDFHASYDESPSRFLNVLLRGTYVTPHRHARPPKSETFIVLEGRVVLFVFDESGRVERREKLGPGESAAGIDIAPGIWHTIAVLSPQAVCFEVKPGPYDPAADKEFAQWAPREGEAAAAKYLESLLCEFEPLC